MTREEIMTLDFNALETRAAEIAEETRDADAETLDAINAELDAIEERKKALETEAKEKRKAAEAVASGRGKTIERKENNVMSVEEIRNSKAYIDAYANAIRKNDTNFRECRRILSEISNDGDTAGPFVPVPSFVAEIVAARLEESEILSRVRKMSAPGIVKVGFEASAPAAVTHIEGGDPVSEEVLILGLASIIPETYKKYVQVSDESLDLMGSEALLSYLYDEITRGIEKAKEDMVITVINAAPATLVGTSPSVPTVPVYTAGQTPAAADFINARALLSSAARDLVIICTPAQYAAYRAIQLGAGYAIDPFDGLPVLFNDTITSPIIGDLSGIMVNTPKGEAIEFKYDDKTLMTSDMVKVLGRQMAGVGVVGEKYFVKVQYGA